MRILFFGDVVGRDAREKVARLAPKLREERKLDALIVNGDNAAGGFGITPQICKDWLAAGVDVITGGDHIWDQKDIVPYIAQEPRLLRPLNFPPHVPGRGAGVFELKNGKTLSVIHLLGQVFHREHLSCPFAAAEEALKLHKLGRTVNAILVDIHAEATSEKNAIGHYLDGRVSIVVGSHTHMPTADARVLRGGTAYQTDAGMCGDYDSIIGFAKEGPTKRFLDKIGKVKLEPASGEATLRGLFVETDEKTGLALTAEAVSF